MDKNYYKNLKEVIMLTTKQLKQKLDNYIKKHPIDEPVVIQLSQPSIGCNANVNIDNICSGFDWNKGKLWIIPEFPVILKNKDRDIPKEPYQTTYTEGYKYPRTILHCPICENIVKKDFYYCPKCGQKLK